MHHTTPEPYQQKHALNDNISRRSLLSRLGLASSASFLPFVSYPHKSEQKNTNFTYCLNTSTIRGQKLGFRQEIEIAARAGYNGIEIWIDGLKTYLEQGHSVQQLKKLLSDAGIKVENAIGFAPWIADAAELRTKGLAQAKQEMDLLAQIGCQRIAAPPAGATEQEGLDLLQAAERYHALLLLGEETGVVPHLEVWGFSKNLHKLSQVMFVAIEANHPQARVLPDIYHLYKGGSDFNSLQMVSGKAIEVFHMNDYPAQPGRETIDDSYRVYPGDGDAPVTQILQTLMAIGEPKVLSLELFNNTYWQQDALTVAKTGLSKMKQAVEKAMNS